MPIKWAMMRYVVGGARKRKEFFRLAGIRILIIGFECFISAFFFVWFGVVDFFFRNVYNKRPVTFNIDGMQS